MVKCPLLKDTSFTGRDSNPHSAVLTPELESGKLDRSATIAVIVQEQLLDANDSYVLAASTSSRTTDNVILILAVLQINVLPLTNDNEFEVLWIFSFR